MQNQEIINSKKKWKEEKVRKTVFTLGTVRREGEIGKESKTIFVLSPANSNHCSLAKLDEILAINYLAILAD